MTSQFQVNLFNNVIEKGNFVIIENVRNQVRVKMVRRHLGTGCNVVCALNGSEFILPSCVPELRGAVEAVTLRVKGSNG